MQGTQNVMDVLLQVQAAGTAGKAKETPTDTGFQELLDGALKEVNQMGATEGSQTVQEKPKTRETTGNTEQASTVESKGKPEEQKNVQTATEEDIPDEQATAAVVAMMAPVIVLPQVTETAPTEAVSAQQALPVQPMAIPAQAGEQMPVTVQQEPAANAVLPEDLPQQEVPAADIISTELIVETAQPQQAEVVTQAEAKPLPESKLPKEEQAQTRFDTMVAKASQEIKEQVKAPVQEPENQTASVEEPAEKPVAAKVAPETKDVAKEQSAVVTRKAALKTEEKPELVGTDDAALEQLPEEPEVRQAEPARPQELKASPAEQIRTQVMENLENDKMEFRMQLEPKELGKVDVRMIMESGKLAVQIMAASPKAVAELQKSAEGLMASMRMQGIEVQTIQVVDASQKSSQHMDGAFNMQHQQQSGQEPGQNQGRGTSQAGSGGDFFADVMENTVEEPERLLDKAV